MLKLIVITGLLFMASAKASEQPDGEINVSGTIIVNGAIDPATLNTNTYFALAKLVDWPDSQIMANIERSDTGDSFRDARRDKEYIDKINSIAEIFTNIQNETGIGFKFTDVKLELKQPNLNGGGSFRLDGELHIEQGSQRLCGLPRRIQISPRKDIEIIYHRTKTPAVRVRERSNTCTTLRPLEQIGRDANERSETYPTGRPIKQENQRVFYYSFTRLDAGERMYRHFQRYGAVADIYCLINYVPQRSRRGPTCVVSNFVVRAGDGETVWGYRWDREMEDWVEQWGTINPLPY